MISVVIPLYNKEEFIAETLQSVLDQSVSNFEVLVIDDGSTDASAAVVKSFDDSRIEFFQVENNGVSAARNLGIEKAQYPYIAFLDADDWWAPTFLEELQNAITQFPEEKIFASGRQRVFKNITERYYNEYLPEDGNTALVNYFKVISVDLPPVNSSNTIFDKSLFSEIGTFKVGVSQHEDHDLWIRLAVYHPIVFINKPLSFYRKTAQNTASSTHYKSSDFLVYIQSLQWVLPQLTKTVKSNFLTYTNSFIFYSFLQNSSQYTTQERKDLLKQCKGLISSKKQLLLKIASHLSFLHLYTIYKFIKK